jgi:hypothetical protein
VACQDTNPCSRRGGAVHWLYCFYCCGRHDRLLQQMDGNDAKSAAVTLPKPQGSSSVET